MGLLVGGRGFRLLGTRPGLRLAASLEAADRGGQLVRRRLRGVVPGHEVGHRRPRAGVRRPPRADRADGDALRVEREGEAFAGQLHFAGDCAGELLHTDGPSTSARVNLARSGPGAVRASY